MSAPDTPGAQRHETIIVVGGGCYGSYYVRQLTRAARAGALIARRVLVVDRDPGCAVTRLAADERELPLEIVTADWREFFARYLGDASADPASAAHDAIVPSPLMPHLMGEWLVGRARERFVGRVSIERFEAVPDVPWERAGEDGSHYVSFATWMCPINCVEPRLCPHTRGPRDWSMPAAVERHARGASESGRPTIDAVLFCRHRAYGVGMFDTAEVLAAEGRIRDAGDQGPVDVVIGTVSHCHGALTRLAISAPGDPGNSALRYI